MAAASRSISTANRRSGPLPSGTSCVADRPCRRYGRRGVENRLRRSRTHRKRYDVLAELVLAMGWTQASKVAQDFGNALMWLLLRALDKALATHVAELGRRLGPSVDLPPPLVLSSSAARSLLRKPRRGIVLVARDRGSLGIEA